MSNNNQNKSSIFATGNNTNSNTSSLFSANQGQSDNKGMNSSPFGTAGIFGKSDGSNPFNNSEPKKQSGTGNIFSQQQPTAPTTNMNPANNSTNTNPLNTGGNTGFNPFGNQPKPTEAPPKAEENKNPFGASFGSKPATNSNQNKSSFFPQTENKQQKKQTISQPPKMPTNDEQKEENKALFPQTNTGGNMFGNLSKNEGQEGKSGGLGGNTNAQQPKPSMFNLGNNDKPAVGGGIPGLNKAEGKGLEPAKSHLVSGNDGKPSGQQNSLFNQDKKKGDEGKGTEAPNLFGQNSMPKAGGLGFTGQQTGQQAGQQTSQTGQTGKQTGQSTQPEQQKTDKPSLFTQDKSAQPSTTPSTTQSTGMPMFGGQQTSTQPQTTQQTTQPQTGQQQTGQTGQQQTGQQQTGQQQTGQQPTGQQPTGQQNPQTSGDEQVVDNEWQRSGKSTNEMITEWKTYLTDCYDDLRKVTRDLMSKEQERKENKRLYDIFRQLRPGLIYNKHYILSTLDSMEKKQAEIETVLARVNGELGTQGFHHHCDHPLAISIRDYVQLKDQAHHMADSQTREKQPSSNEQLSNIYSNLDSVQQQVMRLNNLIDHYFDRILH